MKTTTLLQRRKELLQQLEAIKRQIEDVENELFGIGIQEKAIIQRFMNGDYVVLSFDRDWWVSKTGEFLERVSPHDLDRIQFLVKQGIIKKTGAY